MQQNGYKVQGLRSAVKAMRQIGVPDQALKDASKSSAEIVAVEARTLAPTRTGALRNSIRVASLMTGAVVRAGGARVPYGNPIHWGWAISAKTGKAKNIRPQPFFVRALGYKREEVLVNYFDKLEQATQQAINKQNMEVR